MWKHLYRTSGNRLPERNPTHKAAPWGATYPAPHARSGADKQEMRPHPVPVASRSWAAVARTTLLMLFVNAVALGAFLSTARAEAYTVVGDGTPESCDNNVLRNAIEGGGTVSFACGAEVHTIIVDTYVVETSVVIDGENRIVLDGENLRQIFIVNEGISLTLRNIRLQAAATDFSPGGAIYNVGDLLLENTTILNSRALGTEGQGGAIANLGGSVALIDSRIEGNQADVRGGGIYQRGGSLTVERSVIQSNAAPEGGGVVIVGGSGIIEESEIRGNTATLSGGGLVISMDSDLMSAPEVSIHRSEIVDNEITGWEEGGETLGGGIYLAYSVLAITQSTLAENRAAYGGGIFSTGTEESTELTIVESTLSTNRASQHGGGLWSSSAVVQIRNSTLSANHAGLTGGGVYLNLGPLDIHFTTFSDNVAEQYNSIARSGEPDAEVIVRASVFAGESVNGHCMSLSTNGYNLSIDETCVGEGTGDLAETDPQLGPLADNGGPTWTHLPGAESPVLDSVPGAQCFAVDQRGETRPTGPGVFCDRGAVERDGGNGGTPTPTPTPTDTPTPTPTPTETPTPTSTPVPDVDPDPVLPHAVVTQAVKATIGLAPNRGYEGQGITVSGQSPSEAVRVFSVVNGQTLGQTDAPVQNGSYSFRFTIPAGTRPGTLELCVVPVARANGEMSCANLTIDPPPDGAFQGRITFPQAVQAGTKLQLSDQAGKVLYETAVQANGNFAIQSIKPGIYNYAVVGKVPAPVSGGNIKINPAVGIESNIVSNFSCLFRGNFGAISANPSRSDAVRYGFDGPAPAPQPLGMYFSGVNNEVTFQAEPQASGDIQRVVFRFLNASGRVVAEMSDSTPPYQARFNVGRLDPSTTKRHGTVQAYPVVAGREECPAIREIQVLANPVQQSFIQPFPTSSMVWDANARVYRLRGVIPYIPGILPADFVLPPNNLPALPFLGRYNNRLNTGLEVAGYVRLDGWAYLETISAIAEVRLMNQSLIPANRRIVITRPNQRIPVTDLRNVQFPFGPYPLVPEIYVGTPFIEVPVVTFFGLVDATVVGQAGVGVSVSLRGWVRPLRPDVQIVTTGTARANAELGVGLRLLGGIAGVGGTSRLDIQVDVPFTVGVAIPRPYLDLDACLTARLSVRVWGQLLWGLVRKDSTRELFSRTGCVSQIAQVPEGELDSPDFFAAPSVAAAPNGALLTAYIENRGPAGGVGQLVVVVRHKPAGSEIWSEPVVVSNPIHSAADPVVAFAGPDAMPVVAWMEYAFDANQATALGEDAVAHMQRTEIVYSYLGDGSWHAPVYLTADLHGDGLPTLAGSSGGATLAWTRDLDGNIATRQDQYIGVAEFQPDERAFGTPVFLTAQAETLNADVQVAYDETAAPPIPYLAWINDVDGNLQTAGDRRLVVARRDGPEWTILDSQSLPSHVDSPTLSAGPSGVHVAFLERQPAEDGTYPLLGTNGLLWTAMLVGDSWQAAHLLDEHGATVFGEQPRMAAHANEVLLLFRRFGTNPDNSLVGQLSLSRNTGSGFTPPLYLTDSEAQSWQPDITIDPMTGQATVVKVTQQFGPSALETAGAEETRAIAATQSIMAADAIQLSTQLGGGVELLTLSAQPDPALDPIQTSRRVPGPGTSVVISVTVRNVGRNATEPLEVGLYQGALDSGVPLESRTLSGPIGFNETVTISFTVPAQAAETFYHARIAGSESNAHPHNDTAAILLGQVTTPEMTGAVFAESLDEGIVASWQTNTDEDVAGYRVLRSASLGGEYEVAGETRNGYFYDALAGRGERYCYAVQAYNHAGQLSPVSDAVCGETPLHDLYVPTLQRDR